MMDYAGIRKRTAATIAKSGKTVTFRLSTPGGFDPATGLITNPVVSDTVAKAVEVNYSQMERDGTNVLSSDRRFLVAGLELDNSVLSQPSTIMKLVVGTSILSIINVMPLEPGDVAVIYEVQARA
jgi:hypothetical protein